MTRPLTAWAALLLLTCVFVPLLTAVRLPAAFLVGPLLAAVCVSMGGPAVRVPLPLSIAAQALIGCMIARVLEWPVLRELARDWPLFAAGVFTVLIAACVLSLVLQRWRVLPGTSAIWGSFPGAALVMTLMAEAYGEDVRLVAFMQYLRVVCVALAASLVARLFTGATPHETPDLFPPLHAAAFGVTLLVALPGGWIGARARLPAGPMLVPLLLAAILQNTGLLRLELPPALLAVSYAVIGWSIGARFSRDTLGHVARALPRVLLATLGLIALCALLGHGLAVLAGIDPLTAFLATSPGGADSVAIIAAGSPVDVPFVVAMQTTRFLVLVALGPVLARFLASWANARMKR